MRLIRANIESFGKLESFKVEFDTGVNVFNKENGAGKTTLSAFIRAMLYGFGYRVVNGIKDAARYQPWGSNGKFGGSLTVEKDGERYRIERFFGLTAKSEQKRIVKEATGTVVNWDKEPGEVLLGLTAEGYDRSAYYPQEAVELASNDNLDARLANLVQNSADNYDKIQDKLRAYKKNLRYEKGVGGVIAELESKQRELDRKLYTVDANKRRSEYIDSRLAQIEQEREGLSRKAAEMQNEANELRGKLVQAQPTEEQRRSATKYEELHERIARVPVEFEEDMARCDQLARQIDHLHKERHGLNLPLLCTAGALVLIGIVMIILGAASLMNMVVGLASGGVLAVAGVCMFVYVLYRYRAAGGKSDADERDMLLREFYKIAGKYVYVREDDLEGTRRALWETYAEYKGNLRAMDGLQHAQITQVDTSHLQQRLTESEDALKDISAQNERLVAEGSRLEAERAGLDLDSVSISDQLLDLSEQKQAAEYRYRVANTVSQLLEQAKENLSVSYLPKLCVRMRELIRQVTGNDLQVELDRNFSVSLRENEQTKKIDEFSRGTREIALLCFRIALSELLYDGDIPLLVIDDAFVNFDEYNFRRATALLKSMKNTQVIYFTCHDRLGDLQ